MHVLLLSDSYPPEVRSASLLMEELAQGLSRKGHRVSVITSVPRYNLSATISVTRQRLLTQETIAGINIIRVLTPPIHNTPPVKRGLGQLLLPLLFALPLFSIKGIDVSIVYSPPLPLGLTAYFLKILRGVPYIFNVQDLFPKNAIDLQILKNPILIKSFQALERFIYHHADYIVTHSPGNRHHIIKIGINPDKIKVIPNWVDTDKYHRGGEKNCLGGKLNLDDKFVVLFAGVMGYAQDMQIIVDTARFLKNYPEIVFLLIGDGSARPRILEQKLSYRLDNIVTHSFVPLERYPELASRCDACLVTLKKNMRTPVVPSKILGYMAAGKPIIASLNEESEANEIIARAGCGWAREIRTFRDMAEAILKLRNDARLRKQMGENGKRYVTEHFDREKSLARYEQLLAEI